MQSKDIGNFPN